MTTKEQREAVIFSLEKLADRLDKCNRMTEYLTKEDGGRDQVLIETYSIEHHFIELEIATLKSWLINDQLNY